MKALSVAFASPVGVTFSTPIGAAGSTIAPPDPSAARNAQVADLGAMSSDVNLLRQAATAASAPSSGVDLPLTLPPLPPMPAPAKPAAVATDDHGQSNVVFSDSGADSAFIS